MGDGPNPLAPGTTCGCVARWRRWEFELRAPADEFRRHFERGLLVRGVRLEPARHFDLVARAFGSRAYVKFEWAETGLAATVKFKSGLFGSPAALERMLLESGREAQAKLFPKDAA